MQLQPTCSAAACSVCFTDYTPGGPHTPWPLSCGHTFCLQCLSNLADQGSVVCPRCNQKAVFPFGGRPEGVTGHMKNIVNTLPAGLPMQNQGPRCDECHNKPAKLHCTQCLVDLCEQCDARAHSMGVTRRHERVDVRKEKDTPFWAKPGCTGKDGDLIIEAGQTRVLDRPEYDYRSVRIARGGLLRVRPWDGNSGGSVVIRSMQPVTIDGTIDVSGVGCRGGKKDPAPTDPPCSFSFQGECPKGGMPSQSTEPNRGGGGGGISDKDYGSTGGGGGSYGTAGQPAQHNTFKHLQNGTCDHPGGKGGQVYGSPDIGKLLLGSGGGAGHPFAMGITGGGEGGNGGGAVHIAAPSITVSATGVIKSDGSDGKPGTGVLTSGGGGGSGGSVLLEALKVECNGELSAVGGKGGFHGDINNWPGVCTSGGDGGMGRICVRANDWHCGRCAKPEVSFVKLA